MRIGIRAHDVKYAPLDELIPNIHNQGFHCMHIALSKSIKEFKPEISTMTPGLAMYIKELCAENKVDVAVLGCYLNLCNPNPEQHKKIVEKYKAHIRFASILGCGVVGTETGAVNEEYKYEPANHSEEALETFIENPDCVNNTYIWHRGNNKSNLYYKDLYPLTREQNAQVRDHYKRTGDDSEEYIVQVMNDIRYKNKEWSAKRYKPTVCGVGYV